MDDVRAFYEDKDRYQVVDVREPWEWQAGRIEGAVLIPLNDVMAGAESGQLETRLRVPSQSRYAPTAPLTRIAGAAALIAAAAPTASSFHRRSRSSQTIGRKAS